MDKKTFSVTDLTEKEREDFAFVKERINTLQESRKSHHGTNIDTLFSDADRDSVPHRLKTKGKRIIATDEEKGWRGTLVQLGSNDWQSDIAKNNPYVKIQIALSILIDQNPSGVFSATAKKYENSTQLIEQLYERSWEYAKSKAQLKLFVYNLCKYGWAIGRTYPLNIPSLGYDDIFRENLDPRNCWIDDMARPNNPFTFRDWTWRKVYPLDSFQEEFGDFERAKLVQAGGNVQETVSSNSKPNEKMNEKLVEVLFYENRLKDLFCVIAKDVPVILKDLPIKDAKGIKKLSCWHAYWTLRHAESPYGIGLYEACKYDNALLDRIRNMTIDQLTLAIYKMFFYQGTNSLTETGDITVSPGVGKQVLDPKSVNWLETPGPGVEAWKGLELFQKDIDTSSGIGDPLEGDITGKTAFELAQAKEAALKRLKTPLDNILDALNEEGYITVALIQMLYTIPKVYKITDETLVDKYLQEIEGDKELYSRDDEGNFEAKVYPEFPLNLDKDEKGNLTETKDTKFFRIRPSALSWEGIVNIKSQSILSPSKQVEKALDLEMYNMLIPLLAQPPQIYGKIAKALVKLYDHDPQDILPDEWMNAEQPQKQPLFMSAEQVMGQKMQQMMPQEGAQTLVPRTQGASNPQSFIGKIASRLTKPFR